MELWQYLLHYVKGVLAGCQQKLDQAIAVTMLPDGPYFYGDLLENEKGQMAGVMAKLGEARACIENFEAESALEILKPLASHSFADSAVGEALRKIINALEDFDTFTAEEGINAIMERVEK